MAKNVPVARFSTVGMRLGMAVVDLLPLIVLAFRLAAAGRGPWFLFGMVTAMELLFLLVASAEWLAFFPDHIVRRTIFGQKTIAYADISEVSGRGGLRIVGARDTIVVTTEAFLRSSHWTEAARLLAEFSPQANFDDSAIQKTRGRLGPIRFWLALYWGLVVVTFAIIGYVALHEGISPFVDS